MHVALVEPQIPQNTGSIARTCAATHTPLHIIGQPAFEISDRTVRRAGLDYWPLVDLHRHNTWEEFSLSLGSSCRFWYLSKHASALYWDVQFEPTDVLVFGSETAGLGLTFLESCPPERIIKMPMSEPGVRSLNLSNAVSIVLYEALRQQQRHSH